MKILQNIFFFILGGAVIFLATPEPEKIPQPQPAVEAVPESGNSKPDPVVSATKMPQQPEDINPPSLNDNLQKKDPIDKFKSIIKLIEECPSKDIVKLTENIIDLYNDGRIDDLTLGSAFLFLGKRSDEAIPELILSNVHLLKYNAEAVKHYMASLTAKNPEKVLQLLGKYKIKSDHIIEEIYKSISTAQIGHLEDDLRENGFSKAQLSNFAQARAINEKGYSLYSKELLIKEGKKNNKIDDVKGYSLDGTPIINVKDAAERKGIGSLLKVVDSVSETAGANPRLNSVMAASVSSLAKMDLDDAMKWAKKAESTPARSVGLSIIVNTAISQNPDKALEFIKAFPDAQGDDKLNMLLGLESGLQQTTKLPEEERADLIDQTKRLISTIEKGKKAKR